MEKSANKPIREVTHTQTNEANQYISQMETDAMQGFNRSQTVNLPQEKL